MDSRSLILVLLLLTLVPSLIGGVVMSPWGWIFRREQPRRFWTATLAGLALLVVAAFVLDRMS